MLDQLRNLNLDRIDIEDAIAGLAFGKTVAAEFGAQKLPVPEWLQEKNEALAREINIRRRDQLAATKKELLRERDKLRTADEKRADLDRRLSEIDTALAQ